MGQVIEYSLLVASPEELRAAAPGWKLPLAAPLKIPVITPFTQEPVAIWSTRPAEPFDPEVSTHVVPTGMTATPLAGFDNQCIDELANQLLSASGYEAARAFDVPLVGPIAPETDGLYRVAPVLVEAFARMNDEALRAATERWVQWRKSGWHERSVSAGVEQDWEDHVRLFAETSRRATSENRELFVRLVFKEKRLLRRRHRAHYHFDRHDFHPLFLRLTQSCHDALVRARALPRQRGTITIEHLLVGLMDDAESDFSLLLSRHGFEPRDVRAVLAEQFDGDSPAGGTVRFDGLLFQLLVDTFESQAFSSRLVRMRSLDILYELLSDGVRYHFEWLTKRLGTLTSRTKFRLVRLDEVKESREARAPALV